MSITAYGCGFDFRESSVTYMLYLIYYRSARCYSEVNWGILDGIIQDVTLQPQMPSETHAVFRTLIFSIFYLILSIFLVITCILAFGESHFSIGNFCYLMIYFSLHSGTEKNWKVAAFGVLAVLCTVHHYFCCNHRHGFTRIWFLSF
jgi:hypothetical protein